MNRPLSEKIRPSVDTTLDEQPLGMSNNSKFVNGNAGKKTTKGQLITSKFESQRRKDQQQKLEAEAELRPNSVATAATKKKQHSTHSQINNFLMQQADIPEQSDSELTAKTDKIQFIYDKLGSKQKFEEYLTQRRADMIRDKERFDESTIIDGKGEFFKNRLQVD